MSPYVNYVLASDMTRNSPFPLDLYSQRPSENYASYFEDQNKPCSGYFGINGGQILGDLEQC
jgi:hypothetical protein